LPTTALANDNSYLLLEVSTQSMRVKTQVTTVEVLAIGCSHSCM